MKKIFEKLEGFQWHEANSSKNLVKHNVTTIECEQVFFNKPIIVADSKKTLINEQRWYLLGRTDENRTLFIVFTVRRKLIRIISARNMSKKEREIYYEEVKKHTEL